MRFENKREYRRRQVICMVLGICSALLLTGSVVTRRTLQVEAKMEAVQKELAGNVFRFHVLADDDSKEAQDVKRKVRDALLSDMKEQLGEGCSAAETKRWARDHEKELARKAEEVIRQEGYSYPAEAQVTTCYFPDKRYGDVFFPKGTYEALRVRLGRGSGHNWWCVLYPNLCFTDASCQVVGKEGKEELEAVLTDEEYEMVTATSDFKIKYFFFGEGSEEK